MPASCGWRRRRVRLSVAPPPTLGSPARLRAERSRGWCGDPEAGGPDRGVRHTRCRGRGVVRPSRARRVWDLLINAPFLTASWVRHSPPRRDPDLPLAHGTDAPGSDVARSSDEWIAAVRSELAAVEDPRERRRFARAVVVVVVVRRTLTAWTWLLAGGVAVALALGLLGLSRARVGTAWATSRCSSRHWSSSRSVRWRPKRLGSFSRGLVVAAAVAVLSAV